MVHVAIVYHSGFGHTAALAKSVERGAKAVDGAEVQLIPVDSINDHWSTLESADAIIFGSPTYMGSASAKMKEFMENSSKLWYQQKWKDKLAAGFTNSGSQNGDKLATLIQFAIFAAQHGMIWVGLDLLPGNNSSAGSADDLNRMGSFLGMMAQSNVDEAAEATPRLSDHQTAEHLGRRVAEAALRWRK